MKTYPLHGHQLSYDALLHENETLKQMNSKLQGDILSRDQAIEALQAKIAKLKGVADEDHCEEEAADGQ